MNTTSAMPHIDYTEQALPAEVAIQSDTWLTRYRNFPAFSKIWLRHRATAFAISYVFFALFAAVIVYTTKSSWINFLSVLIPMSAGGIAIVTLGQMMAIWVRGKNFGGGKEIALMALALLLGGFLSYGVLTFGKYGTKYVFFGDIHHKFEDDKKTPAAKTPLSNRVEQDAKVVTERTENAAVASTTASSEKSVEIKPSEVVAVLSIGFVLLYMGSGFDLWVFIRQRKRLAESIRLQELKRAQEARREAELRLAVLAAQIEPHFLFNTLAGVRSAILTEPLRATAIVDHLVDYLRSTIPQMRGDGSSEQGRLAKQLDAARAYLGLMQARIPRLSFSVDSELKDAALPPLILISLVENAIKHGIEPKIGPAHITVKARYVEEADEEKLEVSVSDDGVGFGGATSGSGIGLNNIRERLESMYGDRARLVLKARPEGGVVASIVLPLVA